MQIVGFKPNQRIIWLWYGSSRRLFIMFCFRSFFKKHTPIIWFVDSTWILIFALSFHPTIAHISRNFAHCKFTFIVVLLFVVDPQPEHEAEAATEPGGESFTLSHPQSFTIKFWTRTRTRTRTRSSTNYKSEWNICWVNGKG